MSKTWKLMKLAFDYYSLGFQRIIFMILGACIAFLIFYLIYCQLLIGTAIPALGTGFATGGNTLAGAEVQTAVTALVLTIKILLTLAAIGLVVGYLRHYLAVLSYYDEKKYPQLVKYRAPKIPEWLMNFSVGKMAEAERLKAINDCIRRCARIKGGID